MDDEDQIPRRTWLAAERTFLAWWRTGLATAVAALAVGRVLPEVATGAHWPYAVLGLGYAAMAFGIFGLGLKRHRDVDAALRKGDVFTPLPWGAVLLLSGFGVLLALATIVVVAGELG